MPLKYIYILGLLFLISLSACSNSGKVDNNNPTITIDTNPIITGHEKSQLTWMDSIQRDIDTSSYPIHFYPSVCLLTTGTFHKDNIEFDPLTKQWIGIFKSGKRYYMKKTELKVSRVNDIVVDDENEKTALKIQALNKDLCLYLIEDKDSVKEGEMEFVKTSMDPVLPGKQVKFNYKGLSYKLFAVGNQRKGDNEMFYWNYKLFLSVTVDGKEKKTLLDTADLFEFLPNVELAGDIDGDGIIDIILSNSRQENFESQTLFLSRSATGNNILKPVGNLSTNGC